MRILEIAFCNLNSLAGGWTLDLTHPDYEAEGIFAITGPTGAGKSTILDAISLALYGSTPRLGRISKNANEIMSRHTGWCSAEVVFEAAGTRYRCHWSQRRARRKPSGDLQTPKHEIVVLDDDGKGTIIESKLRDVQERVATITGMDFEQFSRGMLLAQGGFAAFLQADPGERAPLLEKITGTDIYRRISRAAHQRHADERARLQLLQDEMKNLRLLSDDEAAEQETALRAMEGELETLERNLAEKNNAIAWLESMARLREELEERTRAKTEAEAAVAAFALQRETLLLAERALELAGPFQRLETLRAERSRDADALTAARETLPTLETAATTAAEQRKIAEDKLTASRREHADAKPLLKRVREIDVQLAEKEAPLRQAEAKLDAARTATKAAEEKLAEDEKTATALRNRLESLGVMLTETAADAALAEQLAGLNHRFDTVRTLRQQHAAAVTAADTARAQHAESEKRNQGEHDALASKQTALTTAETELTTKRNALAAATGDGDAAMWKTRRDELKTRRQILETAEEALEERSEHAAAHAKLTGEYNAITGDLAGVTERIAAETRLHEEIAERVKLLEKQLILLRKIESHEDARRQLRPGDPCPLCGSTEHPYADAGPLAGSADDADELQAARTKHEQSGKTIAALQEEKARLEVRRDHARDRLAALAQDAEVTESSLHGSCALLGLDPALPDVPNRVAALAADCSRLLAAADAALECIAAAEREAAVAAAARAEVREALAQAEQAAQTARHDAEILDRDRRRLDDEARRLANELDGVLAALRSGVGAFGIADFTVDAIDDVYEELVSRKEKRGERETEKLRGERELERLELELRQLSAQRDRDSTEAADLEKHVAALRGERDAVLEERGRLFDRGDPDAEDARLAAVVGDCEAAVGLAIAAAEAARGEAARHAAAMTDTERSIERRDAEIREAGETFAVDLAARGFADEAAYRAAVLDAEEREHLRKISTERAAAAAAATRDELDTRSRLEAEEDKRLTAESMETLARARDDLSAARASLHRGAGEIEARLRDNAAARQQRGELVKAIDERQAECLRWSRLHELIGSHDGSKYSEFAQGLTFEIMLAHANRQLAKLSDRYLLVRDAREPLALNVMDNYQAGEIRGTKNLSGGESFLVSLSLALGLSDMASRNVRVDSLFLDEGFGSLDGEALDAALDVLAGLRREGRVIGAISHVAALRERIGAQIRVTPVAGGVSVLRGPGCRRVDLR